MIIIIPIIKIRIETIYFFTGDRKQISLNAEPGYKIPYWPPGKLFRF